MSRQIRAYSLGMVLGTILVAILAYPTGSASQGDSNPPSTAAFCRVEAVLVRVNTLQECADCGNQWFYSYRYDPVTIDFIHRRVGLKLIARAEEWDESIPDIGETEVQLWLPCASDREVKRDVSLRVEVCEDSRPGTACGRNKAVYVFEFLVRTRALASTWEP